jgi:hypothetical protein
MQAPHARYARPADFAGRPLNKRLPQLRESPSHTASMVDATTESLFLAPGEMRIERWK